MSFTTEDRRLSAKPFAKIVGMVGLPDVIRPPPSVGASSVASTVSKSGRILGREEPCFVTKTICYTHEQARWINAVDEDRKVDVESLLKDLGIVSHNFCLEDPSNLVNLDRIVHKAMDTYAFVAFTASLDTLDALISMIQRDNDARQQIFDTQGLNRPHSFDYAADCYAHPTYELVALHPEHFLPLGRRLSVYDDSTISWKTYVVASDRVLRETQDISSPPLPAFSYSPERTNPPSVNPFLVILNADIKFRRYNRIQPAPPSLHPHVVQLMTRTSTLASLLYWQPGSRPNTVGARVRQQTVEHRRRNQPNHQDISGSDNEMGELASEKEGCEPMFRQRQWSRRRPFRFPEGANLETRMAIGAALMSGHDLDYDSDDEEFLAELHASNTGASSPSHFNDLA